MSWSRDQERLVVTKHQERSRWIWLIKDLRRKHKTSILGAERIALTSAEWRRWVERQINADRKRRRLALSHIKT